ncbi:MAG: peptidoglycan-binding protein [Leptolyngbyaceae cyanobacterium SL_7_1]|nr:peptidoglycan-binding protein [Leptolyngbyaceae cyanobacterium SL_7_1]
MNLLSDRLLNWLRVRRPTPGFPSDRQICLFNKRPTLYRDLTQVALQEAVNELQSLLISKGCLTTVTGKFDRETEQAVRQFQAQNQLFVDGVAGPLTWSCLCYPRLSRQDKTGWLGAQLAMREVQTILHQEGFLHVAPTGQFDRATEGAIRCFQRTYGLKDDGVVGAATWAVLLGMRQKSDRRFPPTIYLLPHYWLPLWEQMLMISCIVLGIYHSPLPGTPPHFPVALTTAYGLTYVVPFVLEILPLGRSDRPEKLLLQYAPYVLTGMLWKPLMQLVEHLILR